MEKIDEKDFLLSITTMALVAIEHRVNLHLEIGRATKGNLQALRQILQWSRECNAEMLQREVERFSGGKEK